MNMAYYRAEVLTPEGRTAIADRLKLAKQVAQVTTPPGALNRRQRRMMAKALTEYRRPVPPARDAVNLTQWLVASYLQRQVSA